MQEGAVMGYQFRRHGMGFPQPVHHGRCVGCSNLLSRLQDAWSSRFRVYGLGVLFDWGLAFLEAHMEP